MQSLGWVKWSDLLRNPVIHLNQQLLPMDWMIGGYLGPVFLFLLLPLQFIGLK